MSGKQRGGSFPLPPPDLRFMGESDERFVAVGIELAGLVLDHVGSDATILDVGSGYGRLAFGLLQRGFSGRYDGFDILPRHVAWCRAHVTPIAAAFRFHHLDVRNGRYNPTGMIDPVEARFPVDGPFGAVAVYSVFTHMDRASIAHYLAEIWRVLRPGGVAISTFFLWDEERLEAITSPAATYRMVHQLDAWTRYASAVDPLHAIAYHTTLVRGLVEDSGFEIVEIRPGSWDGSIAAQLQDLVVIRRPRDPMFARLRRWLAAMGTRRGA